MWVENVLRSEKPSVFERTEISETLRTQRNEIILEHTYSANQAKNRESQGTQKNTQYETQTATHKIKIKTTRFGW